MVVRYIHVQGYSVEKLVKAKDRVGRSVKIGISWDGSTRYLDVSPPTKDDVDRIVYLQINCGELYSPDSHFGRTNR